jgi:hypothetical protein
MTLTSSTFDDSVAYEGSVAFITNAATASFKSITMTNGKAIQYGGAIYVGGTGSSSVSFSNCAANVYYYESADMGGFMYVANPYTTLSSSGCCYDNLYASTTGKFIEGTYLGSFASSCT